MKKFLYFLLVLNLFILKVETSLGVTYYSRTSGNWGTNSTWSTVACDGVAATSTPTFTDDVIICSGHVVTMNRNMSNCNSLIVYGTIDWFQLQTTNVGIGGLTLIGGNLTWSGGGGTNAGTLNVSGTFTVSSGTSNLERVNLIVSGTTTITGTLNITNSIGDKTFGNIVISGAFNNSVNQAITINGNLQNDGTYTVGSGQVTFTGASNNTITGTSTTAFTSLNINKGTSNANILDVQSIITLTSGGLTLTNGTLKLTNSSTNITPFTVDITTSTYRIPSTTGLWCNGSTINSGNINWTVAGLLRISAGTINLGTNADNSFIADNTGTTALTIEGGTMNVAGRVYSQGAGDNITFTMTEGTLNVNTVGSTSGTIAPIMFNQAGSSFTMSNGTIVLQQAGASNLGFTSSAGTFNITGGTIQIGNASTPASQTIGINSSYPIANLSVNSSNATAQLSANLEVLQSVTITAGTLNANNFNLTFGNSWSNSGTFTPGTGTIILNGTGTQTITKSGGETLYSLTINKVSGTVVLASNLAINSTLTMTSGNINCSTFTLSLGTSTVSTGTLTYAAGTIIGSFKRWVNSTGVGISFPIGTASNSRSSLITFTNIVGGTLTLKFTSTDPGSSGLSLNESGVYIDNQFTEGYWELTAADGLSSTNYNLELNGDGFTSYSVSASTRLLYRATSGSSWSLNGTHSDASGSTAKRTAISGLSAQFGFGKPGCSPYSAVSITGSNSVCISTTEAYSVTNTVGNTYTWVIAGGTVASGQTTNSITVDWGVAGMIGNVQVTERNSCGDDNSPVSLAINVNPITTSSITGPATVYSGETGVPYSVTNTSGYSYSWSFPSGGGTVASGDGTNSITVDWGSTPGTYSVRVDVTRTCGSPDFQTLQCNVNNIIKSKGNGNWAHTSTWIGGVVPISSSYVEIQSGHTVNMNGNPGACYKLTINGIAEWSLARTTNVGNGGIIINSTGNISGTGSGFLTSTGGLSLNSNSNISSSTVTVRLQTSSQNITTTGTPGALNILDVTTSVNNNGTLTIANSGTLSGSGTLTQGTNSTLNIYGTTFTLNNLVATASENTVNYGANASQTVRAATYNNLTVSTTGTTNTKTLGGNVIVNGNINITGVTLDASTSNYSITTSGDWTNTGTFNPRNATVTFNGSSTQTITKASGETFNNLNMTGSGSKNLAGNVTINFDFTLNSTVNAGDNDINILGNWDNSGTYNATSNNNVTFSNNTNLLGTSSTIFNNLIINGILTSYIDKDLLVLGNWTNNGTFNHNNGTVIFNGTTIIDGTVNTSFNNLVINGTLVGRSFDNFNIAGNFTNNGSYTHNNGSITFNGSSTISGTNTSFFNILYITGTLINNDNFYIASNFINNGTFNHNNGTITFNGTSTIDGTSITTFKDIVISGTLNGKFSDNFNIAGNFTNDGIFNHNNGTVTFTGTSQTMSGSTNLNTFNNLSIDYGSQVDVSSGNNITSLGPLIVNGTLVLNSDATSTSTLIDNGISGTGSIVSERYLSINQPWYTSVPVSNGQGSLYSLDANNKMFYWNEPTSSWIAVANDDNLVAMKGYPFKSTTDRIINFTGSFNTGNINLSLTRTPSAFKLGWDLVGNPYPSAIDWDAAGWAKINLYNNTFWIRSNGIFLTYNGNSGVGVPEGTTSIIPAHQAFWVMVDYNYSSGTIGVSNTTRVHDNKNILKNINSVDIEILRVNIIKDGYSDQAAICFSNIASTANDPYDSEKSLGSDINIPQVYSLSSANKSLAINTFPDVTTTTTIKLGYKAWVTGNHTISITDFSKIDANINVYLEDITLGVTQDMRANNNYTFNSNATTNTSRFKLIFNYNSLPNQLLSLSSNYNDDDIVLQWRLSSTQNTEFLTIEKSDNSNNFETIAIINLNEMIQNSYIDKKPNFGVNLYKINQIGFDGKIINSKSSVINIQKYTSGIINKIYNDNENLYINIEETNDILNNLKIELYDLSGKLIFLTNIINPLVSNSISLPKNINNGIYVVSINSNKILDSKQINIIR